ncbi:MAG: hypothetical protein ACI9SC_003246 [Gammaproteobacteria bacterium]|jgi:hypothetical protein
MNDILFWMETSTLGRLMQESTWLFPTAEIFHFIGLSLLMGSLLVVDFRLLGFSRDVPVEAVYKFLPITVIGFSINLVTGILFCFSDPFRYYPNIAFRLKILLVLLAGVNALYFAITAHANSTSVGTEDSERKLKIVAALSLMFWIGVIICGRLIPYVE